MNYKLLNASASIPIARMKQRFKYANDTSINNNISNYLKKIQFGCCVNKFIVSNSVVCIEHGVQCKFNTQTIPNCVKYVTYLKHVNLVSKNTLLYKKSKCNKFEILFTNNISNTIFITQYYDYECEHGYKYKCVCKNKNKYIFCENLNSIVIFKSSKKICFIKNIKNVKFLKNKIAMYTHNQNLKYINVTTYNILRNIHYLYLSHIHIIHLKFLKNNHILYVYQNTAPLTLFYEESNVYKIICDFYVVHSCDINEKFMKNFKFAFTMEILNSVFGAELWVFIFKQSLIFKKIYIQKLLIDGCIL